MFSNHFDLQIVLVKYLDLISRDTVADTESNVNCDLAPTPIMIELSETFQNTLEINSSSSALDSDALVTTNILPTTSGMYSELICFYDVLLICIFLVSDNASCTPNICLDFTNEPDEIPGQESSHQRNI